MKAIHYSLLLLLVLGATLSAQAQFFGCTNPFACNYSSTAVFNDGSCCLNTCYTLVVSPGSDPAEISWELRDSQGGVYESGGVGTYDLCLQTSCYSLFLFDSGGDGWEGATFSLIESDGNVYSAGSLSNGYQTYASFNLTAFCLFNFYGCTLPSACNYDPSATFLDPRMCEFPGCTDPGACNYYNGAGCDDGSCTYDEDACSGYCTNLVGVRPGFVNGYEPDQWAINAEGTGSAYHTPSSLLMIGSNNSNGFFADRKTEVSTTIDATGFYSFTWEYQTSDSPVDDPAYYKINGVETILTVGAGNAQNNTTVFSAQAGDTFTFGIRAEGDSGGNGKIMIHNFRAAAVPCGCTDPSAPNFDPEALGDDGSCCYNNFFHLIVYQPISNLGEASWTISESDNTIFLEGNGGFNGNICLPDGCYIIAMNDEDADGWEGGYWRVEDQDGNLVNQGGQLSEFLYTTEMFLVLGESFSGCVIEGCMDPLACNYRANATVPTDDCCYEGCVTMTSDNPFGLILEDLNSEEVVNRWEYNCPAYLPDNSSETVYFRKFCLPEEGCFDITLVSQQWDATESTDASIYWEDGTWLNSFLILPFETPITLKLKPSGVCAGCMVPEACNYHPGIESVGTLGYCKFPGCNDPSAVNYSTDLCAVDNTVCLYEPVDCAGGYAGAEDASMNKGISGLMASYGALNNSLYYQSWTFFPFEESRITLRPNYVGLLCNSPDGSVANPVIVDFGTGNLPFDGQIILDCNVTIGANSGDVAYLIHDEEFIELSDGVQTMTFEIETGDKLIMMIKRTVNGGPNSGIGSTSILFTNITWTRHENCGCMHELACNYDPNATANWLSPTEQPCIAANGCGDEMAINFSPEANCANNSCAFLNECGVLINANGENVGIPEAIAPDTWSVNSGSGTNEVSINPKELKVSLSEVQGAPDDECSASVVVSEAVSVSFTWEEPLANFHYLFLRRPIPEFRSFYTINGERTYLKPSILSEDIPYPIGRTTLDLLAGDVLEIGVEYSEVTDDFPDYSNYDFELILSDWSTSVTGAICEEGCTYNQASNYNPSAQIDDGTCLFSAGSCPGDFDGSLVINSADLLIFLTSFGNVCN